MDISQISNCSPELAWVAGILEGEGSFLSYGNRRGYISWRITARMTDGDVLKNVQELVGGRLRGPMRHKNGKSHWKEYWCWDLDRRDELAALLPLILPFMGERRQKRIREMLAEMESRPRKTWRHGTRHAYDAYGCRCEACFAAQSAHNRKYNALRRKPKSNLVDAAGFIANVELLSEPDPVQRAIRDMDAMRPRLPSSK